MHGLVSLFAGARAVALRAALAAWLAAFAGLAAAHELRPPIIAVTLDRSGGAELAIAFNLEAFVAGIGPEHAETASAPQATEYDRLHAAHPEVLRAAFLPKAGELIAALRLEFDGEAAPLALADVYVPPVEDPALARVSNVKLRATMPAGTATVGWRADPRLGQTVLRIGLAGEAAPFFTAFLDPGEPAGPVPVGGGEGAAGGSGFGRYLLLGFEHIVPKGLDHILFVVGLFLLSPRLRPLVAQVTGFTLAHSVTLALGIYGIVRISPAIVEPLIAASIVFVAVENLFTDRLQRWRPAVVFGFGLLHGLGFAGVLHEIGLPRDRFVEALLGFNIGVELGQLAVIAACFLVVGLWFRERSWYRRAVAMPASAAVALVATVWFFERLP